MANGISKTRVYRRAGWASLLGLAGGPAVSAPNLSVVTRGALFDQNHFGTDSFAGIGVKGAIPLGNAFGFQGDVGVGTDGYYGVGGHLFARDQSVGLLGAFASYEKNDFGSMSRYGVEGEVYWNRITVEGLASFQNSNLGDGFAGKLDLSFYATPNFRITGGVETDPGATFGHAGLEWQPGSWSGVSVTLDGKFGNVNRNELAVGVNFHIGGTGKTLIQRDRGDDPTFLLFNQSAITDSPNAPPPFTPPPKKT